MSLARKLSYESQNMIKLLPIFYHETNEAKPLLGKEHKMNTNLKREYQEEAFENSIELPSVEESTLRRQIAYNQAINRIRAELKRRARPLPILFDEEGKWAF